MRLSGVGWGGDGYLRPDQFLDHLTVIIKGVSNVVFFAMFYVCIMLWGLFEDRLPCLPRMNLNFVNNLNIEVIVYLWICLYHFS